MARRVRNRIWPRLRAAILVGFALAALPPRASAAGAPAAEDSAEGAAPRSRRVLIVHSFGPYFEPFGTGAATFRTELALRSPVPVEFHEVALETARFAEGDVDQTLADYLRFLCAQRPLDLVVSIGAPALRFCVRHRERLFPRVPVLGLGVERRHLASIDLGPDATSVIFDADPAGFVEDILRILPATKHIVVAVGKTPLERYWQEEASRAWQSFAGRVEFTWLSGLPLAGMVERAASLPPHSVIVFVMMNVDAAGVPYEQQAALEALHHSANAPIFGFFEQQLGQGVVGGRLIRTRELGAESARAAVRILGGESAANIPSVTVAPTAPVFDARELERWGIGKTQLPAGSEVRFREPSFWETYRWRILILAALCIAEAALIGMLLANRGQLRFARARLHEDERKIQELRRELSHAGRVTLLGQFTTSLAHELGQPLGAILRNADAAELFLKSDAPDLEEVRAIVADIRRDDRRAAAIIDRLRAMLRDRRVETQSLSWNEVVAEILDIVRADAQARRVTLESDVPADLPPVRGDRVQLQQVLLNLIVNAMDALDGARDGGRRVTVHARRGDDGSIESSVRDTGAGVAPERLATIFEPFFTTKDRGMGMGLAICRSIVEAHGGRLWAENNAEGGATFRFTVPVAAPQEES